MTYSSLSKVLGLGATLLSLTFIAPVAYGAKESNQETYKQLNLFGDVFERIRSQYVKEVTDEELIEAAINGMLTSLDPNCPFQKVLDTNPTFNTESARMACASISLDS